MQDPLLMTRADLLAMGAAAPAAQPTVGALESVTGGLDQVEGWVALIDRVVPLFERFGAMMMQMQGFEQRRGSGGDEFDDMDESPVPSLPAGRRSASSPRPPTIGRPASSPTPPTIGRPVIPEPQPPTLDPQKVYRALLEGLAMVADQSPDMTVADALVMAREHKALVIPAIETAMEDLTK